MYFGSVRFFKHLILTVTALLIIVPTVLCILLAVDNGKKSDEIDRLNSQLSAQSQVSQISDDQSRTSSATESSDNVKAEPSVTESVKPETSAAVPETTKAPETTPASSSAVEPTVLCPPVRTAILHFSRRCMQINMRANMKTVKTPFILHLTMVLRYLRKICFII